MVSSRLGKPGKRGDGQARPCPYLGGRRRGARPDGSEWCGGTEAKGRKEQGSPGTCRRVSARDAAAGLSQAGWAGVIGLLMVILFISLAASPELCLQQGLVVLAAPALCLDRGLL